MPEEAHKKHQTLLGFDFGMKRIGIAVGQTLTRSATPVAVITAQDGVPDWDHVKILIETWSADGLIVGIPLKMDGTEQPITYAARQFARKLRTHFVLPVYTIDERLTTLESKRQLAEQYKIKGIKLPEQLDSYAAKLILEQWLQDQVE